MHVEVNDRRAIEELVVGVLALLDVCKDVLEDVSETSLGKVDVLLESVFVSSEVDVFLDVDRVGKISGAKVGVMLVLSQISSSVLLLGISRAVIVIERAWS
jgi:hypothetical protein